jgi:hypothetical protein
MRVRRRQVNEVAGWSIYFVVWPRLQVVDLLAPRIHQQRRCTERLLRQRMIIGPPPRDARLTAIARERSALRAAPAWIRWWSLTASHGLQQSVVADELRISRNRFYELVLGKRSVTADTGIRPTADSRCRRDSGGTCRPTATCRWHLIRTRRSDVRTIGRRAHAGWRLPPPRRGPARQPFAGTRRSRIAEPKLCERSASALTGFGAISLREVPERRLTSPVFPSWNQLEAWLRAVDGLRLAA